MFEEAQRVLPHVYARTQCELHGRASHHGWEHALDVLAISLQIARVNMVPMRLHGMISLLALLHDVADHKMDARYNLALDKILSVCSAELSSTLRLLIKCISFSSERKLEREIGSRVDWNARLGVEFATIRNVVSDADKLTGLGELGFRRMLEYSMEVSPNATVGETADELFACIVARMVEIPDYTVYVGDIATRELRVLMNCFDLWVEKNKHLIVSKLGKLIPLRRRFN